jgi:DNA-binding IclR family transcriptional regulator
MQESRGIKSIETAGLLLDVLSMMDRPADLRTLAEQSQMSPSVAHAYLISFSRLGLVQQDSDSRRYRLGPLALELGLSELRSLDPIGHVLSAATRLRDELHQVTAVSVWGSSGPTVIRVLRTEQVIHTTLYEGAVLPLDTTATGRIFSAYMPRHMVAKALRGVPRDFSGLVAKVKEQGIAAIEGLPVPGVSSMSSPIFDHSGGLVCALTVTGRQGSSLFARNGTVWTSLLKTARSLSSRFGWREGLGMGEA